MNIEEYIASGILESYVLDELPQAERIEVKKMAENHAAIQEEIDKIETSIESLAFRTSVQPPSSIRETILKKIDQDDTPVIAIGEKGTFYNSLKYAAAASLLLALASGIAAFNYFTKWKSAEDRLADLVAQNQQFADNYNKVNQQLDNIQEAVGIMNNAAYTRVVMNGTDNSPNSLATIYWNQNTQDVFLSIQNLKELSQDQQYQLWAIVDGKPVDAGVFDPDNSNFLVQMKNIGSGAAAFAVTIEPRGGSESPSLDTMQVLGNT